MYGLVLRRSVTIFAHKFKLRYAQPAISRYEGCCDSKIRSLLRDEAGMSATPSETRAVFSPQRCCAIACSAAKAFDWEDKR
jgi:hypothetical protein